MQITFISFLTTLYTLAGIMVLVGYVPQAVSVWKSRTGARDISLSTWSLWTLTSGVGAIYASLVVGDLPYLALCIGNVAGCAAVVTLIILRRLKPVTQFDPV
jgi:uncharacterized protein with PQ loop repeat